MELDEYSKQQQQSEKEGFEYIDVLLENLERHRLFANEDTSINLHVLFYSILNTEIFENFCKI